MSRDREVIEYATAPKPDEVGNDPDSPAHTSLRFAVAAGVGEAIFFGIFFLLSGVGPLDGALTIVLAISAFVSALLIIVFWALAAAFSTIAWYSRDGPRQVAAVALIAAACEVVVAWAVIRFLVI